MVELTRLNGTAIIVNSDLIKTAEASPDTMLTLINGEKLIVRESPGVVIDRVVAYRARLLSRALHEPPREPFLEQARVLADAELALRVDSEKAVAASQFTSL